jgi:repressor of nif and glnA expression
LPFQLTKMKLLPKAHTHQRRLIEILRVIDDSDKAIGARAISDLLSERGFEIGERAVRYNLKILDELGFTKKLGYAGRSLTPLGMRELSDALVNDRIGFVNTRIEEYMYRTTFIPGRGGKLVVNTSLIGKEDYERAAEVLNAVFDSGYGVSRKAIVAEEGDGFFSIVVPRGCLGIATVCSITLDGILLRNGIPVTTTFAGVAEVSDSVLERFTELIAYAGSSIDPMRAFLSRRITRITEALSGSRGRLLANVREVPLSAANEAIDLLSDAARYGIGGLIKAGEDGWSTFGCPVSSGKVGIAISAGVNGPAAVEEAGIQIKTTPISAMAEYSMLRELR